MNSFTPLYVNNILSNFYKINEYGDIISKKSHTILQPKKDKNGYLKITLCTNESIYGKTHKRKTFGVSQLVAKTYIGEPPAYIEDPTVDHIDGNIDNNHFTNLRWLERGVNSSIRKNKGAGSQNHEAKLTEIQVEEICNLLVNTNLSLRQIADRFNVEKSTINNIKQHKNWKNITTKYDFSCRTMVRDVDGKFKAINTNLINNKEEDAMKHTELIMLLDKSGSMSRLTNDTIEGFNGFVESQKDDTKTTLTTVLFDTSWKILHDGIDVYEVSPMTTKDYIAGGGTAMLDAIGETINRVQDRHDDMGENKPDNVLFVITTDGEENSSKKFTKEQIEKMIKHQTNGHGWEFIFLGANMDAVTVADNIGISYNHAINYDWTSMGTDALYNTITTASCAIKNATLDSLNLQDAYTAAVNTTTN